MASVCVEKAGIDMIKKTVDFAKGKWENCLNICSGNLNIPFSLVKGDESTVLCFSQWKSLCSTLQTDVIRLYEIPKLLVSLVKFVAHKVKRTHVLGYLLDLGELTKRKLKSLWCNSTKKFILNYLLALKWLLFSWSALPLETTQVGRLSNMYSF